MDHSARTRRGFLKLAGATAFVSAFPKPAVSQPVAPINFGYQNTSWGTIGMIAESRDMFKKAGANVNVFRFDAGKTTRDAMISGRVDIGVLGSTPFVIGAAKGDMVGIGVAMYAAKTDSVVAGVKSGVKTMKDLKGRKIGSQIGSATDYVLQNKILPKFGLSPKDMQFVNVPLPNHVAALAAGSIDAFCGTEPFPSVAEVEKIGVVLIDYTGFDLLPVMVAANRSVLENKRDAVVAVMRGWLAAVKLFHDSPQEAEQIVSQHFKEQGLTVSPDVIKLMLTKLDVNPDFVPDLKQYLEDESKVLLEQRKIEAMPNWDKLLDRGILREAQKS